MQEQTTVYQRLFESANAPIIIINADFFITECNEMVCQLLEQSKNEIVGKTPVEISPTHQLNGELSSELGKKYFSSAMRGKDLRFEWIHSKKDGTEVIVEVSLFGFMASEKKNFFAMWRDLTEVRKKEQELQKYRDHLEEMVERRTSELNEALKNLKDAQSQLIQSEKLASLGILTAGIAHELNNPLNFIMGGYLGLSNEFDETGNLDSEDTATFLEGIKLGVDRAADIVKGLNRLSRDNENYDESCDIHLVLDNCLTILHAQYKKRIKMVKNYDGDHSLVSGNMGKLHQVFINIISNGIDAIEESGTVTINTSNKNDNIEISIKDTGRGISAKDLNKIMDPFYTTKDPGKGTGLGLSISNTIIQDHKGSIEIDSEEEKGTNVVIHIPLSK